MLPLPSIVIGSEGGTAYITAWVRTQLCVAARFDGGAVNSAGAVQKTPHWNAYTTRTWVKGDIHPFHRTYPQWALGQRRRNLYCFRVEE